MRTIVENSNVKRKMFLKETTFNFKGCRQAEYLVEKFKRIGCNDADKCYFFFKKCFICLSEDTIWSIYENATHNSSVRSPIKYFIGACRNQMSATM